MKSLIAYIMRNASELLLPVSGEGRIRYAFEEVHNLLNNESIDLLGSFLEPGDKVRTAYWDSDKGKPLSCLDWLPPHFPIESSLLPSGKSTEF